jgi:hypothetical protein
MEIFTEDTVKLPACAPTLATESRINAEIFVQIFIGLWQRVINKKQNPGARPGLC